MNIPGIKPPFKATRRPDGVLDIVLRFASTHAALQYCWKWFSDTSTTPGYKTALGRLICKLSIEADREERDPYTTRQTVFREEGTA